MFDARTTLHRNSVGRPHRLALLAALAGATAITEATAQSTTLISVNNAGRQGNNMRGTGVALSANGRYVAFESWAGTLVKGDTNSWTDVFVRDRLTGKTECVSVDSSGNFGFSIAEFPVISGDGNLVAFTTQSWLVAADTNGFEDVYLRDRAAGTTERVSVDSSGAQVNGPCFVYGISADGRFVAFASTASDLVAGDTNGIGDVFVRDRQNQTTQRVSVSSAGLESDGGSGLTSISADGQTVGFLSSATNLVGSDGNGLNDVFVHDVATGVTERASVDPAGGDANGRTEWARLSADGRFVAFQSYAANLIAGDLNAVPDVFTRGPDLTLEADPQAPAAGATLTFDAWTGAALQANLLVLTGVNGSPAFLPAHLDSFDAKGGWSFATTVPAGLSGNVLTFTTFGIVDPGVVRASNPFAVAFQ